MAGAGLEHEVERRVDALGYELVELERAGSRSRPILRLRIDRSEGPDAGVTVDDCAAVSRALEPFLDQMQDLGGSYVLEVSSPGVERPLVRERDFERFTGREVAVRGFAPLAGREKRLEGVLLGLGSGPEGERPVRLELADGAVVEVPRAEIARANLVFRWDTGR